MAIELTSGVVATLLGEATQAHPRECCGLLLGRDGLVDRVAAATNVDPLPECRFEIDPVALIAAHRAARAGGPQVLGYYHSHPTGCAKPSAEDCAQASGDGRIWVIVAGGKVTIWRDIPGGFEPLPMRVSEG